jgi:hypothetical protein
MAEEISLVKACMDYFSEDRKLTKTEYQELSREDKEELRKMFIESGLNVAPIPQLKSEKT